jgi:U3 small nucleolar RNA-associated protein 5
MEQMPDLVARLAGLHATLTARLALRESLLSLSGRLDMVLQQVDLRVSTAPAPLARSGKGGRTPTAGKGGEPRRYVEGESEEEEEADAMDVEPEEGSDVGSVEDVELGAESGSGAGSDVDEEEDDENEDEVEDEDEELDEGEDSEEDSEEDESPRLNGFIDDEAEEDEESESE